MKVNTKAHGLVDVLFHVTIDTESKLKCGNFQWFVGSFTTLEKAMDAANDFMKEAIHFKTVRWEQEGNGWKPIESAVVTESGRHYKLTWKLRIQYALLDTRSHYGSCRSWNWVNLNPDPETMKFQQQDMENMEDEELLGSR